MSDIITEYRNENTKDIDILPTIEIVKKMNEEDKLVALAVEEETEHIAQGIDLIAKQFLKGGRLVYFGAGAYPDGIPSLHAVSFLFRPCSETSILL